MERIKIPINIDRDSLAQLRTKALKTDVPYQRLLNQMLKEALRGERDAESRLDRLEKDVQKLKRGQVA